jgi:NAD(P)H-flavin reductase
MTTVRAVTPETPGVLTYDLSFDDPAAGYTFKPGQFNMLYLPGIGESAISVSSDPNEPQELRHTVRAVGNVTRAMTRFARAVRDGVACG